MQTVFKCQLQDLHENHVQDLKEQNAQLYKLQLQARTAFEELQVTMTTACLARVAPSAVLI